MQAKTQYTDLKGTVAADITDFGTNTNTLEDLSKKFGLDETKLKLIGLNVSGHPDLKSVTLICVDLLQTAKGTKSIVRISAPEKFQDSLSNFFNRLDIVLYDRFDKENPSINKSIEKPWSDYMID